MTLSIDKQAIDFSLTSTSSQLFTLSKNLQQKPCILFFFARDFNTSCTEEACAFKDIYPSFKKYNVEVIGISRDDITTHIEFKNKYDLPFELLADPKGEVSKQYQTLFPIIKVSKRVTYLLDKQQKIVAVYESLFEPKKHAQYMLEKVKQLHATVLAE